MKYDQCGVAHTSTDELCDLLYKNPLLDLSLFLVEDPTEYNKSIKQLYAEMSYLRPYINENLDINEFDQRNQSNWYMPKQYQELDIAEWILNQCASEAELQRVGQELLLYQERNLFPLLQFMKYLVDTLRNNKIVWGVGRGSSVSSYVLYLIGVHKINSLYYDLDIDEFLK